MIPDMALDNPNSFSMDSIDTAANPATTTPGVWTVFWFFGEILFKLDILRTYPLLSKKWKTPYLLPTPLMVGDFHFLKSRTLPKFRS